MELLASINRPTRNGRSVSEDKSLVSLWADDLVKKLDCGILLKEKTVADGVAGVNQQAYAQWQISFCGEVHDLSRRAIVVQKLELVLLQVLDELVVLVCDSKNHVHFVGPAAEG